MSQKSRNTVGHHLTLSKHNYGGLGAVARHQPSSSTLVRAAVFRGGCFQTCSQSHGRLNISTRISKFFGLWRFPQNQPQLSITIPDYSKPPTHKLLVMATNWASALPQCAEGTSSFSMSSQRVTHLHGHCSRKPVTHLRKTRHGCGVAGSAGGLDD